MPLFGRSDGTLIRSLDPVRRIMPFLMPTGNGAYVLFEHVIEAAPLRRFLDVRNEWREAERPITLFHLVLRAVGQALVEFPRLNRFVAGSRLYERRGIWLAFSAKKRLDMEGALFTAKIPYDGAETLDDLADRIYAAVDEGRSDRESRTDKEIRFFLRLPAPALRVGVRLLRWLDGCNVLPASFIEHDPLYASVFVANLGSVGLDAAYHHLYEYGSIPIFVTLGRLRRAPVVLADGSIASREVFSLRYTYDERIEDGLYAARALERLAGTLENPERLVEPR
jgi:hypothetical protein